MSLEKWFERFEIETNTTESITNGTLDYLDSCETLTSDDRKFLNKLDYSDDDISQIETLNDLINQEAL